MTILVRTSAAFAAAVLLIAASAAAQTPPTGGKLLLTGGVKSVEGAGGGGLASWAVITGNGTDREIGANVHLTGIRLPDYELRAAGAAVGVFDRFELSFVRQEFDTGDTGAALGLDRGFTFGQDVWGAKVRLFGDAVYDQDRWTPQVAVGVQHRRADQGAVIRAVGGKDDSSTDVYLAATKVLLGQSAVVNATVRWTEANQFGLLGFGGDKEDGRTLQFEGSAGVLLTKRLLVGVEYRTKPDNLGFAEENDAADLFVAYAPSKALSVTAAYVDLGSVATFADQRGLYLSLAAGF